MSRGEESFTTLADMLATIEELVEAGFGDLPVQLLVAPDSTLQALARHAGATDDDKPALMIEFAARGGRFPASIVSTERLSGSSPRSRIQ